MKFKYKDGCVQVDFEGMKGFATRSPDALQDFIDRFQEVKLRMKKDGRQIAGTDADSASRLKHKNDGQEPV
jgi:hypothetical protein